MFKALPANVWKLSPIIFDQCNLLEILTGCLNTFGERLSVSIDARWYFEEIFRHGRVSIWTGSLG